MKPKKTSVVSEKRNWAGIARRDYADNSAYIAAVHAAAGIEQLASNKYKVIGKSYAVKYALIDHCAGTWACNCPASIYRTGMCKHAKLVCDVENHIGDELGYE